MGRTGLFIVLGLAAALSVIGVNINRAANDAASAQAAYMKYTIARNLARTAVNMRLRAIDSDTGAVETGYREGRLRGGIYSTRLEMPSLDTLMMNAQGEYEDSTYRMRLTLQRYPKPFPMPNGAVGIRVDGINFNMAGNPKISGKDHDLNGNDISGSSTDLPGVNVMSSTDSGKVAAFGSKIDGSVDVTVDTTLANPMDYVGEYILNADYRYTQSNPPPNNGVWGSQNNPCIMVVQPDVGKSIKIAGNARGWGLLVVMGSLELAGTFDWFGMVLAVGDTSRIDVTSSTGTPQILGAVIVAGKSGSKFEMKGTADVKYSSRAIENAKYIRKLMAYRIVQWYEY